MSVAIQPRVEEEPSATASNGWLVASADRVCGRRGMGRSPEGGQVSHKAGACASNTNLRTAPASLAFLTADG